MRRGHLIIAACWLEAPKAGISASYHRGGEVVLATCGGILHVSSSSRNRSRKWRYARGHRGLAAAATRGAPSAGNVKCKRARRRHEKLKPCVKQLRLPNGITRSAARPASIAGGEQLKIGALRRRRAKRASVCTLSPALRRKYHRKENSCVLTTFLEENGECTRPRRRALGSNIFPALAAVSAAPSSVAVGEAVYERRRRRPACMCRRARALRQC